jgi:ArsR family transcriptional regulator
MASPARRPDALLSWMEVLADPTRLRLLRLLERNELGVAELCDVVQLPQSTVSRHLKVLAEQGWVQSRPRGTTNLYETKLKETDAAARRLWQLAREQTEGWPTVQQDQLRLTRLLAERAPTTQAFFAGAAGEWDRLRTELYGPRFSNDGLLALLPPEWTVADLGCGTGQTTAAVASHVARVIGVDQSAAMLKTARKRTAGLRNVTLRQGSLEALPLEDGCCDAALLILALSYVEDPVQVLREMARVLRPAGRGVVVDLLRHDREDFRRQMGQHCLGWEPEQLCSLLESAGLESAVCRPLPPEPQAKGPALVLASGRGASRVVSLSRKRQRREETR